MQANFNIELNIMRVLLSPTYPADTKFKIPEWPSRVAQKFCRIFCCFFLRYLKYNDAIWARRLKVRQFGHSAYICSSTVIGEIGISSTCVNISKVDYTKEKKIVGLYNCEKFS